MIFRDKMSTQRSGSAKEVAGLSQVAIRLESCLVILSWFHLDNAGNFYGVVPLDVDTHLPDLSAEILCSHGSGRIDGNV
jgi:hypothetical protein